MCRYPVAGAAGVSGVGTRIDVLTAAVLMAAGLAAVGVTAAGLTGVWPAAGRGGSAIGRIDGGLGTTAGTVCVRSAYTASMAGIDAAGGGVYTVYMPAAGWAPGRAFDCGAATTEYGGGVRTPATDSSGLTADPQPVANGISPATPSPVIHDRFIAFLAFNRGASCAAVG